MKYYQPLLLILAFFFATISNSTAQNWEVDMVRKINPTKPNSKFWLGATNSAKVISIAAPVSMFAAGLINQNKGLQNKSLVTAGGLAISIVATEALKRAIDRKRPYQKYDRIYPDEFKDEQSFPSGHASVAFSTATSLSLQHKKWYIIAPAFGWAAAVSYSRMYLGQHYPTDIIGSAIVGSSVAGI